MIERLTDKVRMSMALANQEAMSLNNDFICPDHILLGMLRLGSGVAVSALQDLGLEPGAVLKELKAKLKAGPDMVTIRKLPQTQDAKKVIEHAILESRQFNHSHVGTEHLLLGVLADQDGVGVTILKQRGVNLEKAREAILRILSQGGHEESVMGATGLGPTRLPFGAPTQSLAAPMALQIAMIFGHAAAEAMKSGQNQVSSGHVLLAMVRDENCLAARAIASCGVTLDALREQLRKLISAGESDPG